MKQDIINLDKTGNRHGVQIYYHPNDNISSIRNYNHGKLNGYRAGFNEDNSINYKEYWNMDKIIYEEAHWLTNQIKINI